MINDNWASKYQLLGKNVKINEPFEITMPVSYISEYLDWVPTVRVFGSRFGVGEKMTSKPASTKVTSMMKMSSKSHITKGALQHTPGDKRTKRKNSSELINQNYIR
jgi:hypothetical protein